MYENIINNRINGNFVDFKKGVKKLTKKQLCELIEVWVDNYNPHIIEILRGINLALE